MMEHYSTQAIDDKNLWRQHLREIALKQTEEREAYRSKRVDSGKVSQGNWQQLFLQGWQLLFTLRPLPTQDTRRGLQENPSEEAPAKASETRERNDSSCEVSQEAPDNHLPSHLMRCGTEIKPEPSNLKISSQQNSPLWNETKQSRVPPGKIPRETYLIEILKKDRKSKEILDLSSNFSKRNIEKHHKALRKLSPPLIKQEASAFKLPNRRKKHLFKRQDAHQYIIGKDFMPLEILGIRSRITSFSAHPPRTFSRDLRLANNRMRLQKTLLNLEAFLSKNIKLKSKNLSSRILKNKKRGSLKKLLSFAKKNFIFWEKLALNKEGGSKKPAFLFGY